MSADTNLRDALIEAFEAAQDAAHLDASAPQPAQEVYGVDGTINPDVCADIALKVIKDWTVDEIGSREIAEWLRALSEHYKQDIDSDASCLAEQWARFVESGKLELPEN